MLYSITSLDARRRIAFDNLDRTIKMALVGAAERLGPPEALLHEVGSTLLNHEAIVAAKGGIEGLVTSAAARYAGRGVRVNAITPGPDRSNLTRRLVEHEATLRASVAKG